MQRYGRAKRAAAALTVLFAFALAALFGGPTRAPLRSRALVARYTAELVIAHRTEAPRLDIDRTPHARLAVAPRKVVDHHDPTFDPGFAVTSTMTVAAADWVRAPLRPCASAPRGAASLEHLPPARAPPHV